MKTEKQGVRGVFARASHWVLNKLGYDRLGAAFARYLLVYTAFTVASSLSGSYFSVFLLRATGSDMALTCYNLLLACVQPFVMLAAVAVLRRVSTEACLRAGLLLHAAAYLILAAVGNAGETLIYLLSALFASGNAFYFTSYTPLMLAYTKDDNRDAAYGAMGLMGTAVSLTLPLMTGFFISAFGSLTGYRALFLLSALVMGAGFLLSFRLVRAEKRGAQTQFIAVVKRMARNPSMRGAMAITFINAVRVAGAACYAPLLMYALLKREAVMGVVTTVCAVISLFVSMAYGRLLTPARRGKSMTLAVLTMLAGTVILYYFRTAAGYAAYTLLGTLAGAFMDNPVVTVYMGVLQRDEFLRDKGAEVHALREFIYAAGRAAGLLPAFFLVNIGDSAALMLLIITFLQLPAALMTIRLQKRSPAEDSPQS